MGKDFRAANPKAMLLPLEQFHFSQREAVFEIGWREFGHDLELRVHIEPADSDDQP